MIRIETYCSYLHFTDVVHLFNSRDVSHVFLTQLPAFGLLAFDEMTGHVIACGFMRTIENIDLAMVDSFCSDPEWDQKIRHEALNLIGASLIRNARIQGKKKLILFTDDSHTLERAHGFGFSNQGLKLYGLDLGDS